MTSITIVMPLPPRELWQNYRGHWARIMVAKRDAKRSAIARIKARLGRKPAPGWHEAVLDTAWFWPDKRRRDPLNAIGAIKPHVDSFVLAGVLVDDDKLMPGKMTVGVDKLRPRVEITVRVRE